MVRPHNQIAVASNLRLGAKGGKMPPLTGLKMLGAALAAKMPRLRRSRCPERRFAP
jgi:hypothetical protein